MNFEFSDEQEQLRDSVRRFLEDRAPIGYVRELWDDPRGTTDPVWGGLAALGVTGLLVPEAQGGFGGGMVDAAVVCEELGRVVNPGPYVSSAVGAAGLVAGIGTTADHADLLPGLADGTTVATVALLEPGRRAEWRSPVTVADPSGDGWALTGTKVHVADLMAADVVLVTATVGVELGVFAVRTVDAAPEATPTIDGTRREGMLTLVRTPARRVGTGDATDAVARTVDRLHTAWVVDGVGAAQRAMEMSVEYAKEREQFGAPIGSFQAVQHLCADMLRNVELARAAAYYACWALDAADRAEGHRAATMALAFAADGLSAVGATTIQVHGGVGYTWEHDAHLYYKRLLTLQGLGGGSADQLEELATIVLD
ncbi:MAG: acyl-CoA dehydrogenase family protein [Acidimicrobiia bacterium]|jgi:acyl-CoA dehydrogenase